MTVREFIDRHRGLLSFGLLAAAFGSGALWLTQHRSTGSPANTGLDTAALDALETMRKENDALTAQLTELRAKLLTSPNVEPAGARGRVAGATDPSHATSSRLINLNTATEAELETLIGIGPSKAKAILDYRSSHGPFNDPHDLVNVKGIGEQTYEGLKDQVTVK